MSVEKAQPNEVIGWGEKTPRRDHAKRGVAGRWARGEQDFFCARAPGQIFHPAPTSLARDRCLFAPLPLKKFLHQKKFFEITQK